MFRTWCCWKLVFLFALAGRCRQTRSYLILIKRTHQREDDPARSISKYNNGKKKQKDQISSRKEKPELMSFLTIDLYNSQPIFRFLPLFSCPFYYNWYPMLHSNNHKRNSLWRFNFQQPRCIARPLFFFLFHRHRPQALRIGSIIALVD